MASENACRRWDNGPDAGANQSGKGSIHGLMLGAIAR